MANIIETILTIKELETFATAIQIVDLDLVLNGADDFTVFAPNNQAFTSLPKITLQKLSQDVPLLGKILRMHILKGKFTYQELLDRSVLGEHSINLTAINGLKLNIDLSNGMKIGNATVLSTNTSAENGIIYPIDRVIIPTFLERSIGTDRLSE
jgi:uncharacterized surface protein with fasciclin (FAS1) repeats